MRRLRKKTAKSAAAAVKTAVTATKAVVKETVKTVKTAVNVVKPVAKATVKKAVETVKNIPNELKEDWEIGISQLKDSGTVGNLFAAYSEGVMNNLENNVLGLKKLVTDPKNTINEIMTDFVDDPIKPLENLIDFYKDIAIASYKGDYETVAYKLGQGTVTVAITGTSYCLASSAATAFLPEGLNLGATLPSLSFDTLAVAGFDAVAIPSIEAVSVSVSVSSAAVATAAGVVSSYATAENVVYSSKFASHSSVVNTSTNKFGNQSSGGKISQNSSNETINKKNESAISYGELDSLGRPTGAQATLTKDMIGSGSAASSNIIPPGFAGGGKGGAGHARGHLIGKQLGGSGKDPRNLVTLYQNPVNTPVMRDFETSVRKTVESGQTVNYSATPIYQGSNLIPSGVTLKAVGSDGFRLDVTILNRK